MIVAAASALVDHALAADHDLVLWAAVKVSEPPLNPTPLRLARIRAPVARGDIDTARHTLEEIESTARDLEAEMLFEPSEIVQTLLGSRAVTRVRQPSGEP